MCFQTVCLNQAEEIGRVCNIQVKIEKRHQLTSEKDEVMPPANDSSLLRWRARRSPTIRWVQVY
jgi:hypothetical protein